MDIARKNNLKRIVRCSQARPGARGAANGAAASACARLLGSPSPLPPCPLLPLPPPPTHTPHPTHPPTHTHTHAQLRPPLPPVQIMGRSETEELSAAQIFYPCMQAADIFFLKADICQLGMDQRKVRVGG